MANAGTAIILKILWIPPFYNRFKCRSHMLAFKNVNHHLVSVV